jgi:hypothetical protein
MGSKVDGNNQDRPLYVSIEMAANLVYLATQNSQRPEEQRKYLDRAAQVLFEMRHHPDLIR